MIQIDERIDEARLRKWAAEVAKIPPRARHMFEECLLKDQNPEYYHGQVAALAFSYQVAADSEHRELIGGALSVICQHIIDKGWW